MRNVILLSTVNEIERHAGDLSEKSEAFLIEMRRYASIYDPVRLSPRQYRWLIDLTRNAGIEVF
jgi:hypothetical protein